MTFNIGNNNNPPLNGVDGNLVNKLNTHTSMFTDNSIPIGPHTIKVGGRRTFRKSRRMFHGRKRTFRKGRKRRHSRRHSKGGTKEKRLGYKFSTFKPKPKTYTVYEGNENMIDNYLNNANVGDFIEYVPNNQMGYVKYVIATDHTGHRMLNVIENYDTYM
jgi:hypothetical protein